MTHYGEIYFAAQAKLFSPRVREDRGMRKPLKRVIATNLRRLMDARPDLDTPKKVAARTHYQRGTKKGENPTARTIQNLLKPGDDDGPSPGIDLIEALALCFDVPPWELLFDSAEEPSRILRKILTASSAKG